MNTDTSNPEKKIERLEQQVEKLKRKRLEDIVALGGSIITILFLCFTAMAFWRGLYEIINEDVVLNYIKATIIVVFALAWIGLGVAVLSPLKRKDDY